MRRAQIRIRRDGGMTGGGRGTPRRGQMLLKPVGVLADVLMHVADGNVKRAAGFTPEIVPPGDMKRLRLTVNHAGVTGVESTEELRQLVHQLEPEHRDILTKNPFFCFSPYFVKKIHSNSRDQ